MSVHVHIHDGPLPAAEPWRADAAGAVVSFEGVVRPTEQDRQIAGLCYEDYPPMTRRELETLAEDTAERHGLTAVRVEHSRGFVPAGQCSFRLRIASPHRKEALAAMDEFIDRMKQTVPIWKTSQWRSADPANPPETAPATTK